MRYVSNGKLKPKYEGATRGSGGGQERAPIDLSGGCHGKLHLCQALAAAWIAARMRW